MRFAWLKEHSADYVAVKRAITHPLALIRVIYNAVFWIFLLPFLFKSIDYGTGFIAFTLVIFIRLILNLATNNLWDLEPQQYESSPFRV